MSLYVLVKDNQIKKYPYTQTDLRRDNTNVSFPAGVLPDEVVASWGMFPVLITQPSSYDIQKQKAVQGTPELADNKWRQTWSLVEMTQPEIEQTKASIKDSISRAVQKRLDDFAKSRGYDDIKSACDYAGCDVVKYSTEGAYCKNQRARTWEVLYGIFDQADSGIRRLPDNYDAVEPELPALAWPTTGDV